MTRPGVGLVAAIVVAAVAVLVLALLGRSQLAAEAPVGGLTTSLVRAAGLDVLTGAGVPLGVAPRCATGPAEIVCDGTRADGAPIRVVGQKTGEAPVVTVTVDGRVLATVPARQVVDDAGSGR